MLRFKPEVRIRQMRPELARILDEAAVWSANSRIDVEFNSIDDGAGVHMPDSLHGYSLAVDADTVGDRRADTLALAEHLRRTLPPGYDVVFEGDHVHVEWDVRRPPLRRAV